ncbi:OmpA family protein [Pendulispora albinea]|uniref:OmpA family protein n=1 Tax=Pendulispora albinea TaxID=2741071 RepID=A0ABZ2LVF3_9BACT
MTSHRILPQIFVASSLPLLLAVSVGVSACGGSTQFQSAQAVAINGTPPPPPPAPPPPPEPPKPPPRVELRDNKIDFKEKIQFQVNKAIIKEESFSLLHDIAEVIKKNPQVKKLSIEGHASAEGSAQANKKLSDERAKSVVEYLVKKEGVEAARLTSRGWGVEKPIASNDTEDGREKNRRVEFLVTEQEVTAKKVEIDPATGKERIIDEKKSLVEAGGGANANANVSADTKKKPAGEGAKKHEGKHEGKKNDAKKEDKK